MFDKNSSFQPSDKQDDLPKIPAQPADQKMDNDKKEQVVEDIFSSENNEAKTGVITEEQKKMAAKVLSPDIRDDNDYPADNNIKSPNAAKDKLPNKSNSKMLFIMFILFVILFLSITAIWYYINYIQNGANDVDNISENVILNKNQNDNFNINTNKKNLVDKKGAENKNQNINKNTNSANNDSDFDGLSDKEEKELGTNIYMADTDGDGLLDKEEVRIYLTDPLVADTDKDGYIDGEEVKSGYNPNGDGKLLLP
ncbi:MAG: hypothetical protein U9O55_03290 [Patescibacteria group bacterium]|nr:hypothetical protein [Patescibacteria group bacterium]